MTMGRKFWFAVVAAVCATGLAALKVIDADIWKQVMWILIPAFVGGNVAEHIAAVVKKPKPEVTPP